MVAPTVLIVFIIAICDTISLHYLITQLSDNAKFRYYEFGMVAPASLTARLGCHAQ